MTPLTNMWEETDDDAFEGCYEYSEDDYDQNVQQC